MHPWERLQRRFPGEGLGDPSVLGVALFEREAEPTPSALRAGDIVKLPETKVRPVKLVVKTSPNAPLLKRLVRYPFKLSGTQGKRSAWRTVLQADERRRAPRMAPAMIVRAERDPLIVGNPLRTLERRPGRAPIPTVDAWLSSGGAR